MHQSAPSSMIDAMLNLLIGCRHRRVTRPITPAHKPGTPAGETYVACLECGKQFQYDLANMCIQMTPAPSAVSETSVERRT